MSDSKYTHELFFKFLTKNKLNELLYRADSKTKFLENQINTGLLQQNTNIKCMVNVHKNQYQECSIYISFYPISSHITTETELYHISFHLYPEKKINNTIGRIHVRNTKNKNRKHVIRINTPHSMNVENSIRMSLVDYPILTRQSTKENVVIALNILNTYFDPESENYLGNKIISLQYQTPHPCIQEINKQLMKKKQSLRITRKQTFLMRNKSQKGIETKQ